MNKLLFYPLLAILTGCTASINFVHTDGTATDIIDESQTTSPDVSPTLSIPVTGV